MKTYREFRMDLRESEHFETEGVRRKWRSRGHRFWRNQYKALCAGDRGPNISSAALAAFYDTWEVLVRDAAWANGGVLKVREPGPSFGPHLYVTHVEKEEWDRLCYEADIRPREDFRFGRRLEGPKPPEKPVRRRTPIKTHCKIILQPKPIILELDCCVAAAGFEWSDTAGQIYKIQLPAKAA